MSSQRLTTLFIFFCEYEINELKDNIYNYFKSAQVGGAASPVWACQKAIPLLKKKENI